MMVGDIRMFTCLTGDGTGVPLAVKGATGAEEEGGVAPLIRGASVNRHTMVVGGLGTGKKNTYKTLCTRRNLSPGYLELEPKIVENWPNKG